MWLVVIGRATTCRSSRMRLSNFLPCCSSHAVINSHSDVDAETAGKHTVEVSNMSPLFSIIYPLTYIYKSKPVAKPVPLSAQAYSVARVRALFETYRDSDDPNVIGPGGFQQLCTDADISLEGVLPLVLAWQLDAKEMAKFTEKEWLEGFRALQCAFQSLLSLVLNALLLRQSLDTSTASSCTS